METRESKEGAAVSGVPAEERPIIDRGTCDHQWESLDGYFWHRCVKCGVVS